MQGSTTARRVGLWGVFPMVTDSVGVIAWCHVKHDGTVEYRVGRSEQ